MNAQLSSFGFHNRIAPAACKDEQSKDKNLSDATDQISHAKMRHIVSLRPPTILNCPRALVGLNATHGSASLRAGQSIIEDCAAISGTLARSGHVSAGSWKGGPMSWREVPLKNCASIRPEISQWAMTPLAQARHLNVITGRCCAQAARTVVPRSKSPLRAIQCAASAPLRAQCAARVCRTRCVRLQESARAVTRAVLSQTCALPPIGHA